MLKIEKKINDSTVIVAEAETQLELFEQLASLSEVFGESRCGKCKSNNIAYRVRTVVEGKKQYTYPEMVCRECYAKLSYGQMEGGKLFPVRHERKDGEYIKDQNGNKIARGSYGWVVYNKDTKKEE